MLCKDHTYVFQARQTATIDESLEMRDDEVVVLLASILKWNGKPRLTCGNVRCPPSQTRMNVLDMLESRKNDRAETLAGKAAMTNGLHLGRSEVLRSLRSYLRTKIQGHHAMYHLKGRGGERGSA